MRISDWSSDVCSSDLRLPLAGEPPLGAGLHPGGELEVDRLAVGQRDALHRLRRRGEEGNGEAIGDVGALLWRRSAPARAAERQAAESHATADPPSQQPAEIPPLAPNPTRLPPRASSRK